MMDRLAHRGPDAEGMHLDPERGVLGHRRLSIMDPQGGDQPIYSEDRDTVVVANGEIYNFPTLYEDLSTRHRFRTHNDSEALVHLFEERGPDAVRAADGMFAIAIAEPNGLFLARDPIGIKPLYYGTQEGGASFRFASELKAFDGCSDEVHEFPPGTLYHSSKGFVPYYQVPSRLPREAPLDAHLSLVRQTLEVSVVKRLMSDVPLGAFLSGGLDSSLIAAIARQHLDKLHTFSVGIEGSDDIEAARLVSRHIDSVHHEYLFTPEEVLGKLPEIIYHLESFDRDLVRSAIPCYFCSRLASEHVKVILTGEGADELFAGYTYYREQDDPDALHGELRRSVASLHNVNLQRVDRLTMAHGLEGRVPFLDLAMIEAAQTVPTELKLYDDGGGRPVEKWILRKACEDLLPPEIVWREKAQFDEGSGTVKLLEAVLATAVLGLDREAYARVYAGDNLLSAEECFYHKLLVESFEQPDVVLRNVGRWGEAQWGAPPI
jgi:asparagine synthase (glutamine-hydrolysing)